ncbi:33K [Mastadenovirus porcusquintum]|uniref:33K n=1 Tax=Mastadenovirus porcusquintum TaxID=3241440 RepID=UPI00001D96E6|nr:33K [Porcine mastadenovirus C]
MPKLKTPRPGSLNLTNPIMKKSRKTKQILPPPPPTPEEEEIIDEEAEEWDEESMDSQEGLETIEELEEGEIPPTPPTIPKKQRRWDQKPELINAQTGETKTPKKSGRKSIQSANISKEPATTRALRARIFPTLYAIFQQSRGVDSNLKVKNRSLRSLTKSCLYHNQESQLQRTLEDAEALLHKYCSGLTASSYNE